MEKGCGNSDEFLNVCGTVDFRSGKEEVYLCDQCTISALRTRCEEAEASLKKVQAIAKVQMDRHPAALNAAREAGFKGASKAYEECSAALKAEKEARLRDNADLTEQILVAESRADRLQAEVERLREALGTVKELASNPWDSSEAVYLTAEAALEPHP